MKILESNWDEFNSYPSVNFYYKHFNEPHVVIFEGYECLYPLVKNKIIIDRPKEIHKLSPDDRDAIIKKKISELVNQDDIITNRKCIDEIHPDKHLYKFLFSSYTKYMIDNKKHLFETTKKIIDKIKKIFLKYINFFYNFSIIKIFFNDIDWHKYNFSHSFSM